MLAKGRSDTSTLLGILKKLQKSKQSIEQDRTIERTQSKKVKGQRKIPIKRVKFVK